MPRQRARSTSPEVRDRNTRDILGRPGLAGMVRTGGRRGMARGGESVLKNPTPEVGRPGAVGSGQLLILTATADLIASGGDYVTFGAELHRRGFDTADIADGQTIIWPTDTVGSIQVEFAWDTYEGGGTVEIEVDGEVPAWGTVGEGMSGSGGSKRRGVDITAGAAVKIKITQTSGSGQTADVTVEFKVDGPTSATFEDLAETVWYDTRTANASSVGSLAAGTLYLLRVEGNLDSEQNEISPSGAPDPVLYPSSGQAPSSDANFDADVKYALVSGADGGTIPTHSSDFTIDTGSGAVHVEPVGGPYSSPQAGHVYEFRVTGEGSPVSFSFADADRGDNNGQFRIEIYRVVSS